MKKNWFLIAVVLILGCSKAGAVEPQPGAKISGKIAFVSDRFDREMGVCILKEGVIKKVSEMAGVSKWSPDGKLLAIAQHQKEFTGITILDGNGNTEQYPLEWGPFLIAWLPDSQSLIFASNRKAMQKATSGNLFYFNLRNRNIRQLTDYEDGKEIYDLAIAPDGKRVIFQRRFSGPTDEAALSSEYLIGDFDGQSLVNAKPLPVFPVDASWSPDGKRIVYASGYYKGERVLKGYLLMYDFETGQETLVYENKEHFIQPVFSPDGKQILVSGWSGLYTMNLDGTNIQQVVSPKNLDTFDSHDTRPDWAA